MTYFGTFLDLSIFFSTLYRYELIGIFCAFLAMVDPNLSLRAPVILRVMKLPFHFIRFRLMSLMRRLVDVSIYRASQDDASEISAAGWIAQWETCPVKERLARWKTCKADEARLLFRMNFYEISRHKTGNSPIGTYAMLLYSRTAVARHKSSPVRLARC